ncbi:MAG: hypothetical protein IT236_14905, partial [Bacteroidia bacterium]|nr:hypothetical protein [Bacteroidia bacterium]
QYAFPERHFQQAFRQISLDDFETLTAQKIYIARTAFGNLINALPIKSKYDFTMYAIDEYGTMEFKGLDFIRAYNFLWQYITNNILSQGKLLVSTYELMQRHLRQTGMPIESVGFVDWGNTDEQKTGYTDNLFEMVQLEISDWDEDKVPSDSIANQALHFQQLFLYMEHGLKQAHLEELTRNDVDEKRFVKLFDGVDWPVDYSV